ncbi:MAG: hypothetical protein A2Z03_01520 [Chloroflexi bacterium RBG_16_56_8]|nr:MAG: hypothetical protein A2Z03_01520 [Chloroflexi bacterium RBG_16_56_8]
MSLPGEGHGKGPAEPMRRTGDKGQGIRHGGIVNEKLYLLTPLLERHPKIGDTKNVMCDAKYAKKTGNNILVARFSIT